VNRHVHLMVCSCPSHAVHSEAVVIRLDAFEKRLLGTYGAIALALEIDHFVECCDQSGILVVVRANRSISADSCTHQMSNDDHNQCCSDPGDPMMPVMGLRTWAGSCHAVIHGTVGMLRDPVLPYVASGCPGYVRTDRIQSHGLFSPGVVGRIYLWQV